MSSTHKKTTFAALSCALAMLGGSAHAVTLAGGDHVSYSIDSALGLFGTASVVGDSLVLTPTIDSNTGKTSFIATGTTGYAGEQVNITVTALSGYQLTGFNLSESGGYTGYSPVNAWIAGDLKAIDIEGDTGISGQKNKQISSSISGSGLADSSGTWTGAAGISLPVSGWGGSDGVVTSVTLTLTNDLIADGSAEIWKTFASVTTTVSAVPEAETYAMMLAGLGLVGFMARRRSMSVI